MICRETLFEGLLDIVTKLQKCTFLTHSRSTIVECTRWNAVAACWGEQCKNSNPYLKQN